MPFEIGSRGQITKRNRTKLADIFKTNQIKGARKIIKRNVQSSNVMLLFNIPCKRTANMVQSPISVPLVVLSHADCTAGPMDVVHESHVCARVFMCKTALYF